VKLSSIEGFEKLLDSIAEHTLLWKAWVLHDRPEELEYPPPYGSAGSPLTPFQKLMLLRLVIFNKLAANLFSTTMSCDVLLFSIQCLFLVQHFVFSIYYMLL